MARYGTTLFNFVFVELLKVGVNLGITMCENVEIFIHFYRLRKCPFCAILFSANKLNKPNLITISKIQYKYSFTCTNVDLC
jgi:hypothetical protein